MSTQNINTLQQLSGIAPAGLTSYTDQYLKQSLANLGQRFSVKGDGVSAGEFGIYELIPSLPVPTEEDFYDYGSLYNAYMMATVVKDDNDQLDIDLTAYMLWDSETSTYYSKSITLSDSDYIIIQDDYYIQGAKAPSVNGGAQIAYLGQDTLISDEGDGIYKAAVRSLSYNHSLLDTSWDVFDYENRRLNSGIRIYNIEDKTVLTHLSYTYRDSVGDNHYTVRQYDTSFLGMGEAWTAVMDPTIGPVMDGSKKVTWQTDDIIDYLEDTLTYVGECTATLNKETHNLMCDSDTFEEAFGSGTEIGDYVEACVLEWNESLSKELPVIRHYYNEEAFLGSDDNLKFKKRIVAEVFAALYKNYLESSQGEAVEDSVFEVYIPYEYLFIYTCNSRNTYQIYSSSRDIISESVRKPKDQLWKICQTGNRGVREQEMICSAWDVANATEDIYSSWKYFVTYDDEELIEAINVLRTYVMPYINNDGYWNINNIDTNIYARGKDGGQPSIIISYSDTSIGKHEILSTMNKDELAYTLDWQEVDYHMKPLDTSLSTGEVYHLMTTYMPVNISTAYLHENLVTFLENAIIMDIASVHNEDLEHSSPRVPLADPGMLGPNATVTTFWALQKDEETHEYSFTYVKQPDTSWAVDFNYLTDAEAIVKYYMQLGIEPDLYRHSWVVFDGVEASLKNQVVPPSNSMIYPTILNRQNLSFNDLFNFEGAEGQYTNNLNFMLGFYNNIEWNGSYVADVKDENTGKFFRFDVYEHFDDDTQTTTTYTYVPVVQTLHHPNSTGLDKFAQEWLPDSRTENYYDPVTKETWVDSLLPTLDLKETFVRNINVLNRYNILTAAANGQMYYSYIGATPLDGQKNILHIGTGFEDISLGLKTLTDVEQRQNFYRQNELDVDFDTIVFNGDVIMPKASWSMYEQEGNPANRMFSTQYELAYISLSPIHDRASLQDALSHNDRYFRIPKVVSKTKYINPGDERTKIDGKTTYMSYVNVNWLCQNVFALAGFNDEALREEPVHGITTSAFAYGEAGRLFCIKDANNTPTYFLQLTTDLLDPSAYLYHYEVGDNKYYFIKPGTVDVSYVSRYSNRGTPTHTRVNIREAISTHSTAYSMYDGGELQWQD